MIPGQWYGGFAGTPIEVSLLDEGTNSSPYVAPGITVDRRSFVLGPGVRSVGTIDPHGFASINTTAGQFGASYVRYRLSNGTIDGPVVTISLTLYPQPSA